MLNIRYKNELVWSVVRNNVKFNITQSWKSLTEMDNRFYDKSGDNIPISLDNDNLYTVH